MAKYFSKFPKTYYTLQPTSYGLDIVTNIISRFSLEQSFKDNTSIYEKYNVQESDTPEIIASKLYDSPERHWIVLAMNDIVDAQFDWPLDYRTLITVINSKYTANANTGQTGLNWAQQNTHSYYSVEKRTILAVVTDPYGNFEKKIKSPSSGYVICANESPVVFKGDAIIHLGKAN